MRSLLHPEIRDVVASRVAKMTNLPAAPVHRMLEALAQLESEQAGECTTQPSIFGSMRRSRAISIPLIEQADGTLIADTGTWLPIDEVETPVPPSPPPKEKPRRDPPPPPPTPPAPGGYPGPGVEIDPDDLPTATGGGYPGPSVLVGPDFRSPGGYPGPSVIVEFRSAGKLVNLKELKLDTVGEAVQKAIAGTLRDEIV